MSDADKGITSNAFALSMSQIMDEREFVLSRCARHLAGNFRENCVGTINKTQKRLIIELAEAQTEDSYQERLEKIRCLNSQSGLLVLGWPQVPVCDSVLSTTRIQTLW